MSFLRFARVSLALSAVCAAIACSKNPPEASLVAATTPPAVASAAPAPSGGISESGIAIAPASAASHRPEVAKALAGALPAAIACFEGSYGTVFVDVAFNPQGAAPQVMFSTKNQLPVESLFDVGCFQSALRGARLGPFSGSAFTATLPVRRMPGSDVLGKLADDIVSGKVALPGGSAPAPAPVPADYVAPKGDAVELTTTDITTLRDFRADRASILGVRLGMSMDDAKAKIGEHPGFSVSLNRANPTRLYVNTPAAPDSVLYLIWSPGNPRLTLITVFRTFEPWLQGGTKGLLHTDALDATSVAGRFLGKPDRSGVTLDVTSIGLRHITHAYARRGLELTEQHEGTSTKVVFAFASPDYQPSRWTPLP